MSISIDDFNTLDRQIQQLLGFNSIPENEVRYLCEKAKDLLAEESNVAPVKLPVTVCGDIHG